MHKAEFIAMVWVRAAVGGGGQIVEIAHVKKWKLLSMF